MKYTLREIKTEEEFIEVFGRNPRWIFSSAPIAAKSNTLKGGDNVSERNGKGRSKRRSDNKTIS
jgi:hypothetical protein